MSAAHGDKAVDRRGVIGDVVSLVTAWLAGHLWQGSSGASAGRRAASGDIPVALTGPKGGSGSTEAGRGGQTSGELGGMSLARVVLNQ